MYKKRNFDIHTDEVNDILSRPPAWFVRSGTIVMSALLSLLVILSAVLKYPDIIEAPVVVSSRSLPAKIVAKRSGRLENILYSNGSIVRAGDVVGVIENGADYKDYKTLRRICHLYPNADFSNFRNLELGGMQDAFSLLVESFEDYSSFKQRDYHDKMIKSVLIESGVMRDHLEILRDKKRLYEDKLLIAHKAYKRDEELLQNKAISEADKEKSYSEYLDFLRDVKNIEEEIIILNTQLVKIEQKLIDLRAEREKIDIKLKSKLDKDFSVLLSEITAWEQVNLLIASVSGTVSFTAFWQENQNVSERDVVFSVIPDSASAITAKIYIPVHGSGKVREGHKVNIQLDNYPYMEFGMVRAVISDLPALPSQTSGGNVYIAEATLSKGMETTYGISLDFKEELYGTALIITKDMSLLSRILYPFKHLLNTYL